MRRVTAGGLVLTVIVAIALVVYLPRNYQSQRQQPMMDRRPELRRLVAKQEAESAQAVAEYQPTLRNRIDDLNISAVDILRPLPGVVQVEACVKVEKPTHRIIHLRDWHFVPKELLAIDMAQVHGKPLSQDEIDLLYEQHVLEVELIQFEQMAVLRCLIKYHGLKRVFSEGFSPGELENYKEKIVVLRAMEKEQIPQIRKQLDDVRKLMKGASKERKEKTKAIEGELLALLDGHMQRLLEMGASGRLLIAGELEDVLPLEDAASLEQAKPITPSGKMELDPKKVEARHDAQVRAAMKEGLVAVIFLGGAHDLTASLQRLGYDKCEYLRVTTKRFKEIGE
jgi:hypothetical protein